jgi:nucleoside-diphosphate-sugar epimerase
MTNLRHPAADPDARRLVGSRAAHYRAHEQPRADLHSNWTIPQPDITFARQMLGWEPQVPIAAGLEWTIAYFRTVADGLKRWVA